jgi:6-phosphofructokinase 1
MPDEFIAANGSHVTDAFRRYLAPLLGSDMPHMRRLQPNRIAKILAKS